MNAPRPRPWRLAAVLVSALIALACSAAPGAAPSGGTTAPAEPLATRPASDLPTLVATTLDVAPDQAARPFHRTRTVLAPPGWSVSLWARVPAARLMTWTPDGQLLVSRPKEGDVVALTPGTGSAPPAQRTLVDGLTQPHGLAFAGSTLYVAESDQVDAFTYRGGALSQRRVVVDGLPDARSPELGGEYAHALKSVTVGPNGAVYVSVGSTGNVSEDDRSAIPERATVLRVPRDGAPAEVFARGVRNGTGLAVDPTGAVWTAVNHRDDVAYPYERDFDGDGSPDARAVLPDYVDDHPLEPLARLTAGRDLGWPYCNPDPDVDPGTPGSPLSYSARPLVRDVQTNPDGVRLDCAALAPMEQGMGAHSAPLGLSFAIDPGLAGPYGPGALVGVHGSWNREPPRAPEVSFFPWRDGTLAAQQTLLGGFQNDDGSRWGRPVMAVQGPDRAVYVSDDQAGAVYRMSPP